MKHFWLLPNSVAVAASLGTLAANGGVPLSAQRQAELIQLVRQDCGSCHGMTLKGGLGKALLPGDLAERSADTLAQIIEEGLPGTPMPPWRGLLSAEDARWIAERLKEGFLQ